MKFMTLVCFSIGFFLLVDKFVDAKIKNDSSIAADTKRIADALAGTNPPIKYYIRICKRFPSPGQMNWAEWLDKNGECETATESR